MIEVLLDIQMLGVTGLGDKLTLFYVDAPKSLVEEVRQAIKGEIDFNGATYEIGGLIYEAS